MKQSEFVRWLKNQGVTVTHGSKHMKLYYKGKQSTLPRHAAELKTGLVEAIKKQLGLK
ncbi:MAG TPA: type II toxin-antitoxin system HicA family toxin [Gallionellaceae bacterium]|nr:type II toxin-antitoxin system HicA family toxin [Gallionellaceae bacterium]